MSIISLQFLEFQLLLSFMKTKKTLKLFKFDKYILLLGIISILFLASVVRYALRSYKIPEWDEQHYMRMATEFYRILQNPTSSMLDQMLSVVPFRQIGYPLLMQPFLMTFGLSNSYFWGIFTNGLLYVATIFGIYLIAKEYLAKLSAFIAAIIFAFYGWTLWHAHLTYSETAVSAFAVWTIFFLIKSNLFQNKKYSILFGIFLGLGLLVKWIVLVYVAGPLIYVLYQIIKKRLFQNKNILIRAASSFIIASIISFYPYLHNSYWIFQYFYGHRVGGPMWLIVLEQERNPLSIYSLTFYLNSFSQLGIFFFILIIAGAILALRKKSNLKPILLAVLISFFFSAFVLLKAERHIIPIYPYLAILSASIFDYIKNGRIKYALVILTIVLSLGTFLGTVWARGPMRESLVSIQLPFSLGQVSKIYLTAISRPPYIYKISGGEILEFIEKDSRESGIENPQVLSLFYTRPLDEPLMTYNLYNLEKPLAINNFLGTVIEDPVKGSDYLIETTLSSDYILTKTGKKTDDYFSPENYKTLKALIELFENDFNIDDYYEQKAKFWIYQDSSEVVVYKRRAEIPKEEIERLQLKLAEYLKHG